jgi:hypothetical protein
MSFHPHHLDKGKAERKLAGNSKGRSKRNLRYLDEPGDMGIISDFGMR